ncbi:MAG TPA: alkaline phosphatase family protein [Rhizomicrobium sp.]|nr:alkaline phosphatase family protein [Rhizomicrobium sp.]
MNGMKKLLAGASLCVLAASAAMPAGAASHKNPKYDRVLVISVDGLHAVDLTNYVASHPASTLAALAGHGIVYPNALTTGPSDSFPGLTAFMTGGTPKSANVFYDVSYDRKMYAPGSNCQGLPGAQTTYDESIDVDKTRYDGGGTLGDVDSQINPANLPMAIVNGSCVPVYPHNFLRVNTIFERIRAHGGRTAWADKHPAYDLVNGPSGSGVEDLFAAEVDSNDTTDGMTVYASDPSWFSLADTVTGQDTTFGYHSVARNDLRKVHAVLNQIDGYLSTDDSHSGQQVGVPTIFGMNFQAVSVGQKLAVGNPADPLDAGLVGGYADANATPNNGLQFGLDFVDSELGAFVSELHAQGLDQNTLIIVSAKHGQSPIDVTQRQAVDDSPYAATPGMSSGQSTGNGSYTTDDVGLVWLAPSQEKGQYKAARAYLESEASTLGITQLLDKSQLTKLYPNPFGNSRTPDFIAITKHGLIYTSGTKLAEHGGFSSDDRNVALVVSNPAIAAATSGANVETRQIAATVLDVLGINPKELDGAREENTKPLPGGY